MERSTLIVARGRLACGALALAMSAAAQAAEQPGVPLIGRTGVSATTAELMARQGTAPRGPRPQHELEYPDRSHLPQAPGAMPIARYPVDDSASSMSPGATAVQTVGVSFNGATFADTGALPPDSMGAVGPTQFVVFVNGRLRTFTKTGAADGVLNADPDVFFNSVMTPVGGTIVLNFTSDPQVRYDRLTARWFLSIIDVPCTNATCTTTAANRWLLAVSDTSTITAATVWTFFFVQTDPTNFCDYPSLGVDRNALYFGCNMFSPAGAFVGTNAYVVRKTSVLGAGPIGSTMFANLATGAGAGILTPRGADNVDPAATEGYFIGMDNAAFSLAVIKRISNPGGAPGTPTISGNLNVTLPTTNFCNPVPHLGNTGGNNGRLDCLDDRVYAASIRGGTLWAAHNIRTSNAGVASTAAQARNSTRWYEFQNLSTTPTLRQSGTVFDSAATLAASTHYWIPSIGVSGQGHVAMGFSIAGTPVGATPAFVGRLASDTLGTMQGPPTLAATTTGTTTGNYNPPADPGGAAGRRWGDYSFTSVDPLDDMTMWTIQEYNQASNSYAVRVAQLIAPPPATPVCGVVFAGPPNPGNVVINATSTAGSGFFDPGPNLAPPALPFRHISATLTGATVNSVTYNSPTQVTLNITALATGMQTLTITNPDGQVVTSPNCVNIATLPVELQDFSVGQP